MKRKITFWNLRQLFKKESHMNKSVTLFLFLQVALLQLSGCSISIYPTRDISKDPKAVKMEFKNPADFKRLYPNSTLKIQDRKFIVTYNTADYQTSIKNIDLAGEKEVSIKYHRSFLYDAPNVSVMVEFPNGNKYPAYVDTGFPVNILLTSDVVLDNKFEIHPITGCTFQGICKIPELNIGKIKVKDSLVFYYEQQWQLRVLNIPICKHPNIILGIEFIKSFDYVLFDNVSQEVVFSKDKIFTPDNPDSWQSYPFDIKADSNSNDRIMVQMPINGKVHELFFDTCGDKPGLLLSQNDWDVISKDLKFKNLRKSHYLAWQSGRIPCRKATISELSIGERKFKNAKVVISNDADRLSLLSLGYFQDTTVVLDYVNNLMWIKKT